MSRFDDVHNIIAFGDKILLHGRLYEYFEM